MNDRIKKVNALIKQEVAQLLLKEAEFPGGVLATVTRVDTSPNLIQSKVYVSFLPEGKEKEALGVLQKQVYFLQQKLNRRLKMRPTPKIIFVLEKEAEKAGKVEELLETLKKGKK
ncbi:MAG: ribosome-binding factor A [Parcubacteria group bacterium Gr01-1014_30]|nr:MAG: ribosome-binding factor A [Parcubacteria group bacterium Gr01-1014_30]